MDERDRQALREYGIELDADGNVVPTAKALAETEATLPAATEAEKLLDARARTLVAAGVQWDPAPNGRPLFPRAEELVEGRPIGSMGSHKPPSN